MAPSHDSAVRTPVPVMMNAIAFPEAQPARFTSSCTMAERLGVCWSAP